MAATLSSTDVINATCPWSGKPVSEDSLTHYDGHVVGFCNPGCRDKFERATRAFDQSIKLASEASSADS